jgi:hypothetical protein
LPPSIYLNFQRLAFLFLHNREPEYSAGAAWPSLERIKTLIL